MTEPLKEQSRMIAKELSWKPTEREELIEIIKSNKDPSKELCPLVAVYPDMLADAILEWHKKEIEETTFCTVEQIEKAGYRKDTYNGGSVTPNKGRMK